MLILDYEIRSSWRAKYITRGFLQELSSSYFAWKVNKKYARYVYSKTMEKFVKSPR